MRYDCEVRTYALKSTGRYAPLVSFAVKGTLSIHWVPLTMVIVNNFFLNTFSVTDINAMMVNSQPLGSKFLESNNVLCDVKFGEVFRFFYLEDIKNRLREQFPLHLVFTLYMRDPE